MFSLRATLSGRTWDKIKTGRQIETGRQQNSLTLKAYMEGIHVGFGRRICTDASSKPLPIADVLSAVFSSPWHKSDGQNCVAPAMERFSSEFWCGGRRNTRVFQGRQAGNHRKSPMSGGTDPFHVCPCFLFVLLFRSQGAFSRSKTNCYKNCTELLCVAGYV